VSVRELYHPPQRCESETGSPPALSARGEVEGSEIVSWEVFSFQLAEGERHYEGKRRTEKVTRTSKRPSKGLNADDREED
jgi:hypothetical protein